ncbi:hypothetical protein HanRHA438_Chr03g0104131 [Helianthus annuus]|nr:hypothetical protein HanRHA438_Chr03g0104131 [Helianthus annuus]
MYYGGGFIPLASSSSAQQPKLQTAFVSNTNSFPFQQSAPPPVFDPSAYYPPAHMSAQAQAYSAPHLSSPYIPIPTPQPLPQVNTTQPQFDPRAYIPVPSQPQVSTTQPQFNPSVNCGPAIQLGNGDQTRTAFHAEIVKNVNDGESSGNDDSSGYSGSSDEESNLNERTDYEADNLSNDAKETKSQIFDLVKKADATSKEMEKILTEDGSFSSQTAFVANVTASTSQVQSKTPSICSDCADMKLKCAELKRESERFIVTIRVWLLNCQSAKRQIWLWLETKRNLNL